jgi:hypothetical protein
LENGSLLGKVHGSNFFSKTKSCPDTIKTLLHSNGKVLLNLGDLPEAVLSKYY